MSTRTRAAGVATILVALLAGAPPAGAAITPANVAALALKWEFPPPPAGGRGVTGELVLHDGTLYVPSWDGNVYALDPQTGAVRWSFATGPGVFGGVLPTADGRICFGNAAAHVYCLRADDGTLVWDRALGTPGMDAVWSKLATANGRLFVSIASLSDQPCTHGRLVALDLATGADLWPPLVNVPDRVCHTDTGQTCGTDGDCPGGGPCVAARGAGVTATVSFDPTGDFVYMNTVGCYTFPSVGDSDSVFKIDAATGAVVWKHRVTDPEQFGFCPADPASHDCGTDADCASVGGTCTPKLVYHDFGFLNGPLRLELPADGGGTRVLLVSGSKDGSLYAFDEDGNRPWTTEVQPVPVSPGFAAYGLFNGALAYADGRIYAALNGMAPKRVCADDHRKGCDEDADCTGGVCLPEPKHLMAFDAATGAILWSEEIGSSWSSVTLANGLLFAGTNATDGNGASQFFAYDTATHTRLATFPLPAISAARAAVSDDTVFVGFGVFNAGGVRAFSLCGNGQLDAGEACDPGRGGDGCCTAGCTLAAAGAACGADDGNVCTDAVCDGAGACTQRPNTASCDDGDPCSTGDVCAQGRCAGGFAALDAVGCELGRVADHPCGDAALPRALAHAVGGRVASARRLLDRARKLADKGRTSGVERARKAAAARLASIASLTDKATRRKKSAQRISTDCKLAVDMLADRGRSLVSAFEF